MLNDSQQMTIRVAVRKARENGTEAEEIRKLAAGMHISEAEVRACADSALGTAPAKRHVVWTPEMVERLTALHNDGMGPAAIAKQMGMKASQVQFKLSSLKLKAQGQQKPEPAVAPAPPSGEPLPINPPEESAEPAEPAEVRADSEERRKDSEPPPVPEPMKQLHQTVESTKTAFSTFPGPINVPDDEGNPGTLIDMPAALLFLMKLVHEHYGDKVIRVHASNDEHYAACAFAADSVEYDLKLEVLGE